MDHSNLAVDANPKALITNPVVGVLVVSAFAYCSFEFAQSWDRERRENDLNKPEPTKEIDGYDRKI